MTHGKPSKNPSRILRIALAAALALMLAITFVPWDKPDAPGGAGNVPVAGAETVLEAADVIAHFESHVGEYYGANACLKWVREQWQALGAGYSSSCCAYSYGTSHIVNTSIDNIPIGADVFFDTNSITCDTCGHTAGHVGVYVGDGYMVHVTKSYVRKDKVVDIANDSFFTYRGWGWHGDVRVIDSGWGLAGDGIEVPEWGTVDEPVTLHALVDGHPYGLEYNFVWRMGDDWNAPWSSTVNETGSWTTDPSWTFTPEEGGIYQVWVDVRDFTGRRVDSTIMSLPVSLVPWELAGVMSPASVGLGDTVTFSAAVEGDASDLSYNYAWSFADNQSEGDSTLAATGELTSDTSYSFTPTKKGDYYLTIDATDSVGKTMSSEPATVKVGDSHWELKGVNAPATAYVDEQVTFSANIEGNAP
ncbi:MAG: PKD domain-containing protein, partial [Coriobacteriales bacterium]|nr:PKD domain-containing protein [Coriobacteriales bacterium]